jgi:hypothetical protein
MRSECGARARSRKPLPGGSGPPLGRHDDRSPRSSVDSRQATTSNTRRAGSKETRELELSQRRMRSPWRVPRRSAERRAARDTSRCRAAEKWRKLRTLSAMRGSWLVRLSALRLPSGEAIFLVRVVVRKTRMRRGVARMIFIVVIARSEATKQSRASPKTGLLRGACHRAGHFGPDPLPRNDECD